MAKRKKETTRKKPDDFLPGAIKQLKSAIDGIADLLKSELDDLENLHRPVRTIYPIGQKLKKLNRQVDSNISKADKLIRQMKATTAKMEKEINP